MLRPPEAASFSVPPVEVTKGLFSAPAQIENAPPLPSPSTYSSTSPCNTTDDDHILCLRKVAAMRWSHSSALTGDLVLRMQTVKKSLSLEYLERGLKTMLVIPFASVEAMHFEATTDEDDSGGSDCSPCCGEIFASEDLLRSHQAGCPYFQEDAARRGQSNKRERREPLLGVHFALNIEPTYWQEVEAGDLGVLCWCPCKDPSLGDLGQALQFSAFLRTREDSNCRGKLDALSAHLEKHRVDLLHALDSKNRKALVGAVVLQKFEPYGHFRGVCTAVDEEFFTMRYSDGDSGDLNTDELADLITKSLPRLSPHRRRRRARAFNHKTSYPHSSSRVGDAYQSFIPGFDDTVVEERSADDLFVQLWAPSQNQDVLLLNAAVSPVVHCLLVWPSDMAF